MLVKTSEETKDFVRKVLEDFKGETAENILSSLNRSWEGNGEVLQKVKRGNLWIIEAELPLYNYARRVSIEDNQGNELMSETFENQKEGNYVFLALTNQLT